MARKRRSKRPDPRRGQLPVTRDWRWRTVPVWLALTGGLVIGWYVSYLGSGVWPGTGAYVIQITALVGFALGLSQITRYWTERMLYRRRLKQGMTDPRRGQPPQAKGPKAQA